MTPFITSRTRRYAFRYEVSIEEFCESVEKLKKDGVDVEYGGLSYLKILRSLRTNEFDIVVRSDHMIDVIDKLNLKPAKKSELQNNIFITPIDGDLQSERFKAKIQNNKDPFDSLEWLNPLRFLWGIQDHESRVQEVREYLLGVYFYEVANKHD